MNKALEITGWSFLGVSLVAALVYANFFEGTNVTTTSPDSSTVGNEIGNICPETVVPYYLKDGDFKISNNKGKITVINFWHIYCTACLQEMPHFEEVANYYGDKVEIIAIAAIEYGDAESMIYQRAWDKYTMSFGKDDETSSYFKALGGTSFFPYTLIVDEESKIAIKRPQSITVDLLKSDIDSLLNK